VHRRNSGKVEPGILGGLLDQFRNLTALIHLPVILEVWRPRRYGGIAVNGLRRDSDGRSCSRSVKIFRLLAVLVFPESGWNCEAGGSAFPFAVRRSIWAKAT
jgi:hypothetical protein